MKHSDLQEGQTVVVRGSSGFLPAGTIFTVEWVEDTTGFMYASPVGVNPEGRDGRLWLYDYIIPYLEIVNDIELWWR